MPGVPCNPPIVLALRGDWVTPPAGMARQSSSEAAAPPAALTPEQSGLLRLVYGAQAAQIIYVAAKLGVPDILKDGPRTSAGIGAAVEVEASTLRRVLRGVSSLGVCAEVEANRFALTEMGEYLRSDRPDSLHWRVLFQRRGSPTFLGRYPPDSPVGRVRRTARTQDALLRLPRRAPGRGRTLRPDHGERRPVPPRTSRRGL
jgi:Dimerisation domain